MTTGNQRVPTLSGRLLYFWEGTSFSSWHCSKTRHEAPTGEGEQNQQVWEFPGASVSIYCPAITE